MQNPGTSLLGTRTNLGTSLVGTPLVGTPLVGTPLVGTPLVGTDRAAGTEATEAATYSSWIN